MARKECECPDESLRPAWHEGDEMRYLRDRSTRQNLSQARPPPRPPTVGSAPFRPPLVMGCTPSLPAPCPDVYRHPQRHGADPICSVCLDHLWSGEGGGCMRLACGHLFHGACLERCLAHKPICPSCRADVHRAYVRPFNDLADLRAVLAEVATGDIMDPSRNPVVERDLRILLSNPPPKNLNLPSPAPGWPPSASRSPCPSSDPASRAASRATPTRSGSMPDRSGSPRTRGRSMPGGSQSSRTSSGAPSRSSPK